MKLALLCGLFISPDMLRVEPSHVSEAMAANPFATSPPPKMEQHAPVTKNEIPAFGLAANQPNIPAPRVQPGQASPFAQPLPQYTRPDEATQVAPPSPSITPIVPRDSTSYKQEELNRRERELLALQEQMKSRLDELKKIEGNVQTMLQEADTSQNEKIRHLIDVYSNMKARQAAEVLSTLDERIAVSILSGMRGRQAGEILTYMQPQKAAKLSEALTRTQLPR